MARGCEEEATSFTNEGRFLPPPQPPQARALRGGGGVLMGVLEAFS